MSEETSFTEHEARWISITFIVIALAILGYNVHGNLMHHALVEKTVAALIEKGAHAEAAALLVGAN